MGTGALRRGTQPRDYDCQCGSRIRRLLPVDPRAGNHGICPEIGAHRIGIANCIGLIREARIFARILRANGFEAYSVICKVAGQPKTSMGIPAQCESIGAAMCNPILQARLLNEAHTDLNVVIGLCVGHDSLFYKYSDAYVTTLVTKDRVTGNNPTAALYTADSYYRKKFFGGK